MIRFNYYTNIIPFAYLSFRPIRCCANDGRQRMGSKQYKWYMILPLIADDRKYTERRSLVASISLNMSRNSLTEKMLLYSEFFIENQMW